LAGAVDSAVGAGAASLESVAELAETEGAVELVGVARGGATTNSAGRAENTVALLSCAMIAGKDAKAEADGGLAAGSAESTVAVVRLAGRLLLPQVLR